MASSQGTPPTLAPVRPTGKPMTVPESLNYMTPRSHERPIGSICGPRIADSYAVGGPRPGGAESHDGVEWLKRMRCAGARPPAGLTIAYRSTAGGSGRENLIKPQIRYGRQLLTKPHVVEALRNTLDKRARRTEFTAKNMQKLVIRVALDLLTNANFAAGSGNLSKPDIRPAGRNVRKATICAAPVTAAGTVRLYGARLWRDRQLERRRVSPAYPHNALHVNELAE